MRFLQTLFVIPSNQTSVSVIVFDILPESSYVLYTLVSENYLYQNPFHCIKNQNKSWEVVIVT